jgi:thioredoxin reductase (NADPH)
MSSEKKILTDQLKAEVKKGFKQLKDDVVLAVFIKKGVNDPYNDVLTKLINEIAEVDKRIKPEFHKVGDAASKKYGVTRSPTLLVSPDKYSIRFTGAPLGEEGSTLIMSIIMASMGQVSMSDDSRLRLKRLREKRHVMIFTSPT